MVTLIRKPSTDHGTEGFWIAEGFFCYSLELPWLGNRSNISCIPAGEYRVKLRRSKKYGRIYHLKDVEGRTYILTHWGNWAGDKSKGFKTHSAGCILLGMKRGWLQKQRAVFHSRTAVRKFMTFMDFKEFDLTIMEVA